MNTLFPLRHRLLPASRCFAIALGLFATLVSGAQPAPPASPLASGSTDSAANRKASNPVTSTTPGTATTSVLPSNSITQLKSDAKDVRLAMEVEEPAIIAQAINGLSPNSPAWFAAQAELTAADLALDAAQAEFEKVPAASVPAIRLAAQLKLDLAKARKAAAQRPLLPTRAKLEFKIEGIHVPRASLETIAYAEKKLIWKIAELPPELTHGVTREVSVSIDYDDGAAAARGGRLRLVAVDEQGGNWSIAAGIALAAIVGGLAAWSPILRDPPINPLIASSTLRRPFSLARCQMAFWLVVVFWSWLYLLLATGQLVLLPDSMLAVLGIAAATLGGARLIEQQKQSATPGAAISNDSITGKSTPPPTPVNSSSDVPPSLIPPITKALAPIVQQTQQAAAAKTRRNILLDILSDENGISIHRLQMVVWTLVLGIYVAGAAYSNATMTDLNSSLLALMGISSGAYVTLKVAEKPST